MSENAINAFESYRGEIVGLIYRITGSMTEAEDLAQETPAEMAGYRSRRNPVTQGLADQGGYALFTGLPEERTGTQADLYRALVTGTLYRRAGYAA